MLQAPGFIRIGYRAAILALATLALLDGEAALAAEKVVYDFKGGGDGITPFGQLVANQSGKFYGTTSGGGGGTGCDNGINGCGTVFQLAPSGREKVLYSFKGESDGAFPSGGLIADAAGNYYGTTSIGGNSDAGTVLRLAPNGKESVLYAFTGASDGYVPIGDVVLDTVGNIYGATEYGGNPPQCVNLGCGVIFEVNTSGNESVLYTFSGGSDGDGPSGSVIRDSSGNIYGETAAGGVDCEGISHGCGTVFKLTPDGTKTVLYAFQGGADGIIPEGGLLMDTSGNLYGTTLGGGSGCGSGCGTVFKVAPDGAETVLYSFKGGSHGNGPESGVVMDSAGNLFGTTFAGGIGCPGFGGCGTVFKLAPDGTETVLYAFHPAHGRNPAASLLLDKNGVLYGTATQGGADKDGVVFKVKP